MKILIVSPCFPSASSFRVATVAQDMAYRGHSVRVLAGFPARPSENNPEGHAQGWQQFERHGDVDVLRVSLGTDQPRTPWARATDYASGGVSAATARGFAKGADVVYVCVPQVTPALGLWLRWILGGAPYVLHVQDLWPDTAADTALIPGSRGVYRRAAGVIGATPEMVDALIKRGALEERTRLVCNWVSDDDFLPRREEPSAERCVRFLCVSEARDMQDTETIVRAAKLVEDVPVKITVFGRGTGEERAKKIAAALDVGNVEFRAPVSLEDMAEVYAGADFSLLTGKDLPNSGGRIFSRFQNSLAAGLPVVTTRQDDIGGLVEDLGLGCVAETEDPESLARVMRRVAVLSPADDEELRLHVCDTYRRKFSVQSGLDSIDDALLQAVGSRQL